MNLKSFKHKGFTLIEILIVISIIGILSTLAVSNYNNIRSSIENSYIIDNLVQEFRSQNKLSQNQQQPTCYHIQIQQESNQIIKSSSAFNPQTRTCQTPEFNPNQNLLSTSQLAINQILQQGISQEDLIITFTPPNGTLSVSNNNPNQISIIIAPNNQPENSKVILINPQNGSIQKN